MTASDSAPLDENSVRKTLIHAKTIVVKVGSRTLANTPELPSLLAHQFAALRKEGRKIVLVSSGAVALGMKRLGLVLRPTDLSLLQAAAATGQADLMRRYDDALSPHGIVPAQVLLTHGDLSNRRRLNNARGALCALLDAGALPIINENDTVSTEELRFSDNDQLSALVTPLVEADALILLTDVPGVLDEQGQRISMMSNGVHFADRGSADNVGRGGMAGKLIAATQARRAGATVVIASGVEQDSLVRVLAGQNVGTCFPPVADVLRARRHWIAYTLKPRGTILVDAGARQALLDHKKSLLSVGVVGLRGVFRQGDAVSIVGPTGDELGRGLSRLSALDVARVAGKKAAELAEALCSETDALVIHRDDLVIWK